MISLSQALRALTPQNAIAGPSRDSDYALAPEMVKRKTLMQFFALTTLARAAQEQEKGRK